MVDIKEKLKGAGFDGFISVKELKEEMGRKSTKENKNIYQISRENLELSREAAAKKNFFVDKSVKKWYTKSNYHVGGL